MRTAYLNTLYELAAKDKNVFALISDNGAIVYDKFRADLGSQYYNMGISEANMLGVAAGMANCGKIPFAYTIGAFLAYRALEFIRNDICLQNQNVKVVGTGAGMIYSALGPTHHATEDMGCLRSLPNLTIFSPASPIEVRKTVLEAYKIQGPVYIRLGTNREEELYEDESYEFVPGKGVEVCPGSDITIAGTGNILLDVVRARDTLAKKGISVRVINIHTIKPFDSDIIKKAVRETKGIITVEDHNIIGGLGSAVAEAIAESGIGTKFKRIGLEDSFSEGYGTYTQIKEMNGIGIQKIIDTADSMMGAL